LRALKSIHSAGIVHRDLKPANLLVNANCDLKVCDFGLARMVKATSAQGGGKAGMMTEYVATRWYRAPEIMLSFKMYTKVRALDVPLAVLLRSLCYAPQSIDVWAVGCILAEMLSGRPLFPGRDYSHQLDLILDVIGTPTLEEFYGITSRRSRDYIRSLPIRKRRPFTALFPQASVEAIDFLNKTLVRFVIIRLLYSGFILNPPAFCQTFDPKKRLTADEALGHPYLSSYVRALTSFIIITMRSNRCLKHDPDDEPVALTLDPNYFNFEGRQCNLPPFAFLVSSSRQIKMILLIRPNSRSFSTRKSFLLSRPFKHSQIYVIYFL
jgi:mitogen-activated protein kinase 1/3